MTDLLPFPKPKDAEGKISLTDAQRRKIRIDLYHKQNGWCACGCGLRMTLDAGNFSSAELDHITPEPAGCKKRDNIENLRVLRRDHNSLKGSRRNV